MENRKRDFQVIVRVTEQERRFIDVDSILNINIFQNLPPC